MKIVKLRIEAASDGEVVIANITEQRDVGNGWKDVEKHVVRSDVDNDRTLLLEENERIIIDGRIQVELVMVNNMVMAAPATTEVLPKAEPTLTAGPLPPGTESQIGVWREADEQDWSRTGKRYRIY